MANRPETGKPIPDDWDGESYNLYTLCAPDSPLWDGFVRGAIYELTRGRGWDANTGTITDAQAVAREIYDSMAKCNDLIKTNRMLVAALVGESVDLTDPDQLSPDSVDYTETGLVPNLNKYLIHLQALGAIPVAGDTIQASLIKLADAIGADSDQTLDDLIDAINNANFTGANFLDGLRDFLEILVFLKLLFGGAALARIALGYWDKITLGRWMHNDLTLKAYQATALRGIQYAISPFDEDGINTEEEILDNLGAIPWLGQAVSRYMTTSPLKPYTIIANLIGGPIQSLVGALKAAWDFWYNRYIGIVGEPEPARTVTGLLTQIAQRLLWDQRDDGEGPYTLTDFTGLSISEMLEKIAHTQVTPDDEEDQPGISIANQLGGIEAKLLLAGFDLEEIKAAIQGIDAQVNINVAGGGGNCDDCGSGGAGATGSPPSTGVGHPDDGDPPPDGFSDWDEYWSYKCGMANHIIDQVLSDLAQTAIIGVIGIVLAEAASILVIALATPVPGDEIIVIAGILIQIVVLGLSISSIIAVVESSREDFVCALYTANTTGDAISNYISAVNDAIDDSGLFIGPIIEFTAKSYLEKFGTIDSFNRLFINIPGIYPETTPCDCNKIIAIGNGSLEGVEVSVGDTIVLNSVHDPDPNAYYARILSQPCFPFTVELISLSHSDGVTHTGSARYTDCVGTFDYEDDLLSLVGQTFQTTELLGVSFQSDLTMTVEIISIP